MSKDFEFRKASYSQAGGGNCVEVARKSDTISVRDTKDRQGGTLAFTADAWSDLINNIK